MWDSGAPARPGRRRPARSRCAPRRPYGPRWPGTPQGPDATRRDTSMLHGHASLTSQAIEARVAASMASMLLSELHDASVVRRRGNFALWIRFVLSRHDGIGSSTRRGGYTLVHVPRSARSRGRPGSRSRSRHRVSHVCQQLGRHNINEFSLPRNRNKGIVLT